MATIRGGDKLEKALMRLSRHLNDPATLQVGFMSGATYPDGTPVAMIAAIQNFGAPSVGIPPRPFFSNMIVDKSHEWPTARARRLRVNGFDAREALEVVGHGIEGQLRKSIIDTNSPPLAKSTLRKRGVDPNTKYDPKNPATFGAKPLIETGHMLDSVTSKIK